MNSEIHKNIQLTIHHVSLLVESMDEAIQQYTELFGKENVSEIHTVTTQKVRVCFVNTTNNTFIELVEPIGNDSPILSLLKKKHSYYHIGYKVKDIKSTVDMLEDINYKALDYYHSEAFAGNACIFMYTPGGHLIELIEE